MPIQIPAIIITIILASWIWNRGMEASAGLFFVVLVILTIIFGTRMSFPKLDAKMDAYEKFWENKGREIEAKLKAKENECLRYYLGIAAALFMIFLIVKMILESLKQ